MPTFNSAVEVDASGASGGTTFTMPTADAILALYCHYDGDISSTMSSLQIDSVAMTSVIQLGDGVNGSHAGTGAYFLDSAPASGTRDIDWVWSAGGARANGGGIILICLDEEAGTISVLDSAVAGHASNVLSGTVDSETTDLVAAMHSAYDANIAGDFGTLRSSSPMEYGPVGLFARAYTGDGAATSTTSEGSIESFGSAVVVSLTELGGGAGSSSPLTLLGVG